MSESEEPHPDAGISNETLLREVNESGAWFGAVKVAPVWARKNTEQQTVSSLEGDTVSRVGDYICKGPAGEVWTQSADKFEQKYAPAGGAEEGDGFRKYLPVPEKSRVCAARIDRDFRVETERDVLQGSAGDYLLKSGDDANVAFPSSVWIVEAGIFEETYAPVGG